MSSMILRVRAAVLVSSAKKERTKMATISFWALTFIPIIIYSNRIMSVDCSTSFSLQ